ncbi:MAG: 4Fe-4S binding protein [Muribaculaceae bacterium]|nr:4Fe-4S binding protein [Muribaculaceae bacterium]
MSGKIKMENNILKLRMGQYMSFVLCLMLMLVVPIWRDHKIFGIDLGLDDEQKVETIREMPDGRIIINTTDIGKDIMGYGGPTPVEIEINDGVIEKVTPLKNQETPEFYGAVRNSNLLESMDGKTLAEALSTPIDGVSGATYSSNALINNMRRGVEYALASNEIFVTQEKERDKLPLKFYITIVIIVAGGVIPLFLKDKRYRTLQMVLNVLLLGFWGGTFISYSLMVSYLTNGITKVVMIPTALMLIAAFIYPMFGKKNYYCAWMCPYGSLQELLGKCIKYKFPMSQGLLKWLTIFRELLWFVLMWLLWTGLWFDWMGYEPFAAFFFTDASAVTLGIAGGFLILSLFIQRPYCRFVCPTGSLFKFSEGSK